MNTITIDTQISISGQSATYREIAKTAATQHKLQIEIKTDSHKPQQHATICRWDGNQWQRVASLLPDAMQSDSGLAYKPNRPSPCDFDKDRARLLQVAAGILG
jgi:hypothetical protein